MKVELLHKYISGNATEEEKKRITEWAQKNSENMREYMIQRKLYDITLWNKESIAGKEKKSIKKLSLYRDGKEVIKIAAIFAIVLFGKYYWSPEHQIQGDIPFQSIYVPAGQRAELMLSDGTKVWLNSRSSLIFPTNFNSDTRNVKLDGEGYFIVTKNAKQPFVVETNKGNVKVLGTEFNVIAYSIDSIWETSLLKGSVEILIPKSVDKVKLEPNTMVRLIDNKLVKDHIKETDYFLWREGLLCFNNISVQNMIEKLKLYYGVNIIVNNTKIYRKRYTGKFRTKDGVEHVLKVLKLNNNFTYKKDDVTNTITIY